MPNVDWDKIKAEYIAGGISQRKLAIKHGVSFSTLRRRAKEEEWLKQRESCEHEYSTKLAQKIASQRAKDAEAMERLGHKFMRKIEMELDRMLQHPGTSIETSSGAQKDKRTSMSQSLSNLANTFASVTRVMGIDAASERIGFDRERLALERRRFEMEQGIGAPAEELEDDGFLDALNDIAAEVNAHGGDEPEDAEPEDSAGDAGV